MVDDPQPGDPVDVRVREFSRWCALLRAAEKVVERGPADLYLSELKRRVQEVNDELVRLGKRSGVATRQEEEGGAGGQ